MTLSVLRSAPEHARLSVWIGACILAYALVCMSPGQRAWAVTCTPTATPEAFGNYNPMSATPTDTVATISVSCTSSVSLLVSYTISLSAGGSGAQTDRKMNSGSFVMHYQIYTDVARSQVWGDGTGGTTTLTGGYLLAALGTVNTPYVAYGRIPASQVVGAASYLDTLIVTVTY